MSNRALPNWIDTYLDFTEHSEAPATFHFWTAASVIAGALRRHVWIDMGYFQWTPNCYIVFVAPPGIVSKSTTANLGMNLLRSVPGIRFGPDAVTWQSLVQSLASSTEGFDLDGKMHTMSAITIVSSEFGTFLNPSDREMVDVLVSLWDGQIGTWQKATKTQGNDQVQNPWINIIACTTPAWIAGNFPEYMIGGGFTSRTIFVYGEEKRKLVAYPGEELTSLHQEMKMKLIHDLEDISANIIGEYKIEASALKWGVEWYDKMYAEHKESLATDRFAGYVARKQTHMHKLAMILAAAEGNSLLIQTAHLQMADQQLRHAEVHMEKVFSSITSQEARAANLLVETLRRSPPIERSALQRSLFSRMSGKEFEASLQDGVSSGQLLRFVIGNQVLYSFNHKKNENGASS